jgi:hypothetical protein
VMLRATPLIPPPATRHKPSGQQHAIHRSLEETMPDKRTVQRARKDKAEGKAPSTQAGEFVREEIEHVREGKHGARSTKQAIAIGLSKARRAGVKLPPPAKGEASARTRQSAARELREGAARGSHKVSPARSAASRRALEKEGSASVSHAALARQAHNAATRRSPGARHRAAVKSAATRRRSN